MVFEIALCSGSVANWFRIQFPQFGEHRGALLLRHGHFQPVATEQVHLATLERVTALAIDELDALVGRQRQQYDLRDFQIHVGPIALAA